MSSSLDESSGSSSSSPALDSVSLFHISPPSVEEGVSHCGSHLCFPEDNCVEHLCMCSFISLVKCLFGSLGYFLIGLFVYLLMNFESLLYILNTSPLSDM